MRKVILAVCSIMVGMSSCVDSDKDLSRIEEVDVEKRIENCEAFENFTVPVREGYTTYVTMGEDTLAVVNEPMTIRIPKGSASLTRAAEGQVNVSYGVVTDALEAGASYSNEWQAVMFEDTESGDYDYNDLIIHVRNRPENHNYQYPNETRQTISIQPIALGGIKDITLGCLLSDGTEYIVTNNVRRDLFEGRKGFINTENDAEPIRYQLKTRIKHVLYPKLNATNAAWVIWFIEVDGKRMYAASSEVSYISYNMANKEGMPYGLVVGKGESGKANGTFAYPYESARIQDAYAGFDAWINKGASSMGGSTGKYIYKFANSGIVGADGKNHKIWDYLDLADTKDGVVDELPAFPPAHKTPAPAK